MSLYRLNGQDFDDPEYAAFMALAAKLNPGGRDYAIAHRHYLRMDSAKRDALEAGWLTDAPEHLASMSPERRAELEKEWL